ncbi:BRO-N domain-containing protein [Cotonvirus japonicus]|uniref:BRO-N domain-containing protein n=1 Tax=Cotonvirus japonicus TaxID=2811091 RepID=A0ABM7NUD0_9VIRU|nr:BRO-N domain-containing protein [Cotonvirus japonicus]BCS83790.1 BRO-N domain-containing protein [Cotonvirus japonicus]
MNITKIILPELFAKGHYSLPPKQIDIENLNKSFYEDNKLSDFCNVPAIYLTYIGEYNGKHVLKFGKSNDFVNRDLNQHRKMYKKFNVIKIWETMANDLVETKIKTNFASKGMLTVLSKKILGIKCKEETKRELVVLNEVNGLDYCINMISEVVKNTKFPQEHKYEDEIKELNNKYNYALKTIKLLEDNNQNLKESVQNLKENVEDLRYVLKKN